MKSCDWAKTAEHLSGLFYIQEASSMLPVSALFASGATPIGCWTWQRRRLKTTQIAALMDNRGRHRHQQILRQPGESAARQYQPLRRKARRIRR